VAESSRHRSPPLLRDAGGVRPRQQHLRHPTISARTPLPDDAPPEVRYDAANTWDFSKDTAVLTLLRHLFGSEIRITFDRL
jgi:hypothetical protein